jgi:hypothetical protein
MLRLGSSNIDFFLSFAISCHMMRLKFSKFKEIKMLQKIFELTLTKVKNYEIQQKWMKLLYAVIKFN